MKTTIGGDRLGSGNKQEVQMKTYSRSTHDLSYLWRSSMSSGTLVPFMNEVGLPGDSFDIDLNCEVMTLPTVGPLFGSYKVQLDVFECPVRLYNGKLHMNMLNIGMDMSSIYLPQVEHEALGKNVVLDDNEQINGSSIWSYLDIRGLGRGLVDDVVIKRQFNAVPYLAYWSVYKQYYANKAEEEGVVIHNEMKQNGLRANTMELSFEGVLVEDILINPAEFSPDNGGINIRLLWGYDDGYVEGRPDLSKLRIKYNDTWELATDLFDVVEHVGQGGLGGEINISNLKQQWQTTSSVMFEGDNDLLTNEIPIGQGLPILVRFPLANIDEMRMDILADVKSTTPFIIDEDTYAPYGLSIKKGEVADTWSKQSSQEGLGIKTYQSDLFNNWISTEWIDGTNGINEVTAVDTSGGEFTIDALNLASKVYNMLNRIAISGGSYDDWLDAVYTHERQKGTEEPVYHGSLIKELAFEEVISNADTEINGEKQPLGTLAGRGRLTGKNKGGKITIKVNEPCFIIGIVSLTPRIDYSQGNSWSTNLKTLNDLHKPALDEIGYQDLITDQMSWFDTVVNGSTGAITYKSAGKQPAWINYMTNVNRCRGNFADKEKEMFMTLNRRYESGINGIEDLTTYIDPSKYNNIFAQTNLDSQNFWVQISVDNKARRKMSAKVIPNL